VELGAEGSRASACLALALPASAAPSVPEGLGLGETWLTRGIGLGEFNAAARGAGVGDEEPPIETGCGRVALKRPTPSKQTKTPIPMTTSKGSLHQTEKIVR
jgi:hypothetical protein